MMPKPHLFPAAKLDTAACYMMCNYINSLPDCAVKSSTIKVISFRDAMAMRRGESLASMDSTGRIFTLIPVT